VRPIGDMATRFWAKVRKSEGCWEWTGAANQAGYGWFKIARQSPDRAHRISWRLAHGEIPPGECVLHQCDNRLCVRPDHLYLGDRIQNAADRVKRERVPRGEAAGWSKLTAEQVRAIRADPRRHQDIAKDYGLASKQSVQTIKSRKTWAWLD
jgi:hypothetical protein